MKAWVRSRRGRGSRTLGLCRGCGTMNCWTEFLFYLRFAPLRALVLRKTGFYPAGHLGRSEGVPGMIRMARARTCYMY